MLYDYAVRVMAVFMTTIDIVVCIVIIKSYDLVIDFR